MKSVFKGRLFQDPGTGETIELFRVGIFALALDRCADHVAQWVRRGLLPAPFFKVDRRGGRKPWNGDANTSYAASQVVNVNRLFVGKYRARKSTGRTGAIELRRFFADVRLVWYEPTIVVGEDGKLIQEVRNVG